jgi:hypothetical protein
MSKWKKPRQISEIQTWVDYVLWPRGGKGEKESKKFPDETANSKAPKISLSASFFQASSTWEWNTKLGNVVVMSLRET